MPLAKSLGAKGLALVLALASTFGVAHLLECRSSSIERAHPELRAMVGTRTEFLLVLRRVRRVSARTFNLKPGARGRMAWYSDASDEEGTCLSFPWMSTPLNISRSEFVPITEMSSSPRLAKEAFGGDPIDFPIRSRKDLDKAYVRLPILRLLDREVFPFRAHFDSGAKLELRRCCSPHEGFVLHVTGVPSEVTEGIIEILDALREANGLPGYESLEELEWKYDNI